MRTENNYSSCGDFIIRNVWIRARGNLVGFLDRPNPTVCCGCLCPPAQHPECCVVCYIKAQQEVLHHKQEQPPPPLCALEKRQIVR